METRLVSSANAHAAGLVQPLRTRGESVPRRVGISMALAIHATPHFTSTIAKPQREGTHAIGEPWRPPPSPPLVVEAQALEQALSLGKWEVDELREEVDRRAGRFLKQERAVQWMWRKFGLPERKLERLFQALFPGQEDLGHAVLRRGSHLYTVMEEEEPAGWACLFLPWLSEDHERGATTAVRPAHLDRALRAQLARGVGAEAEEADEMLCRMVGLIPRNQAETWLKIDQWRSYGQAATTDLGAPYTAHAWLINALEPESAEWRSWLNAADGRLKLVGDPGRSFDSLALPRAQATLQAVYAALLAKSYAHHPGRIEASDLVLFDIKRHLRASLQPLLDWPRQETTVAHIAKQTGCKHADAEEVLGEVAARWQRQAEGSWLGDPGPGTPSIATIALKHLLVLHRSLGQLIKRTPDPRGEHRDVLFQFAAHYLREARIERLWVKRMSDCADGDSPLPAPEDITGHWFWVAWSRILDTMERENESTAHF